MTVSKQRATEILHQVKETLNTAEYGLQMVLSDDPSRRLIGLRNLIVFGRAVTNVLQQLRSAAAEFDDWYQPWVVRMGSDPVMAYFYRLRSEILKEGRLQTGGSISVNRLNSQTLIALMAAIPKPPGAKSFFAGDQFGGTGWEIELPNGEIQKFYIQIPQAVPGVEVTVNFHLAEAPEELKKVPVPNLARHYFAQLKQMYEEASERFNKS
jgi:hypothetical protein